MPTETLVVFDDVEPVAFGADELVAVGEAELVAVVQVGHEDDGLANAHGSHLLPSAGGVRGSALVNITCGSLPSTTDSPRMGLGPLTLTAKVAAR